MMIHRVAPVIRNQRGITLPDRRPPKPWLSGNEKYALALSVEVSSDIVADEMQSRIDV